MFICFATKPLDDRTQGFRFNFAGVKGLTRKRQSISRGYSVTVGKCTTQIHLGKRSIYIERKLNRNASRRIRHFAG